MNFNLWGMTGSDEGNGGDVSERGGGRRINQGLSRIG